MTARSLVRGLAMLAIVAQVASAQDRVMVEKAPVPYSGNPRPAYLRALVADSGRALVPGRVTVSLVVRVDGTVDPDSIDVVAASDSAFIAPVLTVLRRWRFVPAEHGPAPNGPFTPVAMRVHFDVTIAVPRRRR